MVGLQNLDLPIGVRIPVPQQRKSALLIYITLYLSRHGFELIPRNKVVVQLFHEKNYCC